VYQGKKTIKICVCQQCRKEYKGYPYTKYCSRKCSNLSRKGIPLKLSTRIKIGNAVRGNHTPKNRKTVDWKKGKTMEESYGKIKSKKIKKKISLSVKQSYVNNPKLRERVFPLDKVKFPTSYEVKIINICKKNNLPFEYVGNGKFWIGRKNPDFRCTKDKKLLIEVYCKFLHEPNYEQIRQEHFSKYGYKVLFLSDDDVFYPEKWEIICLTKINSFLKEEYLFQ
jgi:hypothetical protein